MEQNPQLTKMAQYILLVFYGSYLVHNIDGNTLDMTYKRTKPHTHIAGHIAPS